MKANSILKCIMLALFIGMNIPSVMAQKNIDKLLEEIEKRDDASVNSVTKRDPKTRKITSVVKSFSLPSDAKMTQRLIEAFEKDEEYTITAIKDIPRGRKAATRANFTFIFQKGNEKRTYTFNANQQKINLSVIIKQGRSGDIDASDISLYFNNGMDFEIPTMNKEQIKELQKSIQKSLKGLKMKNISQLNFDKLGCTITADELEVSL
ncbi:MAG: DUF5024 domain-containing protein [Bacteroides sp.]|nr:DUF5024 domain-containing protein [Bacteroides sp.]